MRSEATRAGETNVGEQVLYMVLELSERSWKVLFASAGSAREDGPRGPGQADGIAAALGGGREEGVERGAGSRCRCRGRAPAVAVDRTSEGGARSACHAHQGAAGNAGHQAGAHWQARLGQARW